MYVITASNNNAQYTFKFKIVHITVCLFSYVQ